MEGSDEEQPVRLVVFHAKAETDLALIYLDTAELWGENQADRYLQFLLQEIDLLLTMPHMGKKIRQHPGYRVWLAKTRSNVFSHGHRILYLATDEGIEVVRVVHTSRDLPDSVK